MDEAQAIAQLKAGDISGLQILVETYLIEGLQAACLITGDRAMAEDIVQAAFLRAFDKIRGFDETRPFRPWFVRMVVNDSIKVAIRQNQQISKYIGNGIKLQIGPRSLLKKLVFKNDI